MASLAATVAVTAKRFSGHINQLGKAQDYSTHGFSYDKTGNFHFMVVCDGHGTQINSTSNIRTNKIIDAFYSDFEGPDWGNVLKGEKDEIYKKITDYIRGLGNTNGIGTTFVGVKIYDTHYDILWVGDSSIWIYEDNNRVFENKTHDSNNIDELTRMAIEHSKVPIHDSIDVKKIDDDTLLQTPAKYFEFSWRDKISMTHSLGHQELTGDFISYHRFEKKQEKHYKIIASSDGFTDVVDPSISPADKHFIENNEHSAEDYTKYATQLWKKEWGFQVPGYAKIRQSFPKDGYDDIAVELFTETT